MKHKTQRWPLLGMFAGAAMLTGCATLTNVFGGVPAPERVQGMSYLAISNLGALEGSCLTLSQHYEQGTRMLEEELVEHIEACEQLIEGAHKELNARVKAAESEAISASVQQDYESFAAQQRQKQQRKKEEWRKAEEERRAAAALQAQLEAAKRQAAARQAELEKKILTTAVLTAVADIEDKPIAHNINQPSKTNLKEFLACVELAYPNKGYDVKMSGKHLSIVVKKASLPRGDFPITMAFTENPEYWRMTQLKVADIEARSDVDRFVLSQNLTAESCPRDGGLF
ncbi:MAG TPA: hypothetical protein VK099_05760 [Alcanivoracaceae bacterium]|nr:hypothetical protein [Alcanivoracaceae bacterium]